MWWTAALGLLSKIPTTALSLFTGINVNGIFTGIGTFFKNLIANVAKYWQLWLVGILLAGNLFQGFEWDKTHSALVKEQLAHSADIASYKKTQADANAKAQSERAILQKESKADADQADANYSGLYAQYRASLMRYSQASGHPVQPGNNQLPTTQGGYGPSESTQLPSTLEISGDDANICAVNTARLQAVQAWAITLPKDGSIVQ